MHGKTFYMVSVAAVVLALAFSLAVPVDAATSAKEPEEPEVAGGDPGGEVPDLPEAELHRGGCVLCYTCGSIFSHRRGFLFPPRNTVATLEYGDGCLGRLVYRHDNRPNYCCTR
jgi:hypothetical protein